MGELRVFTSRLQSINCGARKSVQDGFVQAFGPILDIHIRQVVLDRSKRGEQIRDEEKCFMQRSRNAKAEMELKVLTSCSLSASPRAGEGER